jgi:CRP/FNR family transcriptional regulator
MIAAFENYLRLHTDLSQEDICRISALAIARKLRRNEFLFRQGEVSRHKVFVVSGLLRIFGMTPDGGEHILQFSPENTWTLDAESYDQQTPSHYNISAVEPSGLLLWAKADFDKLLKEIPRLKNFAEQLISRNIYSGRQRLLTTLSATPEEKYEGFVQNSPELLSRLPLRMIAAYLGISLKTLNRVRQSQLLRS